MAQELLGRMEEDIVRVLVLNGCERLVVAKGMECRHPLEWLPCSHNKEAVIDDLLIRILINAI